MTLDDTIGALAHLPDDAQVTISIRKADLVKALEQRAGGPAVLTTTQAAKGLGYTAERWRRWAVDGVVDGAYQDAAEGPWHLPRVSCEAHIARLAETGAKRARRSSTVVPIALRSVPRGPWKGKAGSSDRAATRAQTP